MKIEPLSDYIHKSSVFIYPLLDLPKKSHGVPIKTYLRWEGVYETSDYKYIMLFEPQKIPQTVLEKHNLLEDIIETEEGNFAYVFDLSSYSTTYDLIIEGKYSKLPEYSKTKILDYRGRSSQKNNYIMRSFLYPSDFYKDYSEFYMVSVSLLEEVVELCPKPDLDKETLKEKPLKNK